MADTQVLGTCAARRAGSTPVFPTYTDMAKLANAIISKIIALNWAEGSTPSIGTNAKVVEWLTQLS
jgi:hypothetical protein